MNLSRILRICALGLALGGALVATPWAGAQSTEPADLRREQIPLSLMLGMETVRLPHGEHMGLVGSSVLFDIGSDWGLGPAVYGASSGHRGGLFVFGVEVQRRWGLTPGLSLATGLYAGGGGGAAAPVGGGLMLRPALTLLQDLGTRLQAGLSWSSVRFPSGQIASNQLGLSLAWRSEFDHLSGTASTSAGAWTDSTGLGFDRMSATLTRYHLTDGSGRTIGLVGARGERHTEADGITWGLEAAAAAQGHAAGYMEILGTAAVSTAPLDTTAPTWRLGARTAVGLAGGGAVPTQGGLVGKTTATTEVQIFPGWALGAELGLVRGVRSPLRGDVGQVWLATSLEPDGRGQPLSAPVRTEWIPVWQHHTQVPRADGRRLPLDTVGLELDRYLGEHFYLSGQAHSAFAGAAGAYSIGLVGAGVATSLSSRLSVGAEALLGAAGGGGVSTAGGGIGQGVAWAAAALSPVSQLRLGLGVTRPRRGGGNSPLFELSWGRSFGMTGR